MRTHMPHRVFSRLGSALLFAVLTAAQESPNIEVDVIFPREEMYTQSEIFPIALAVQNLQNLQNFAAQPSLGELSVGYSIMPYSEGITPGGISLDYNELTLLEGEGSDEYHIYVGNSNVTDWVFKWSPLDNFALQFYMSWPDALERCGSYDGSRPVSSELRFNIETNYRTEVYGKGIEPDVMEVPECPNFGMVVQIRPNATHESCPVITDGDNAKEWSPCSVVVDDALKSSIVAAAESMAAAAVIPTPTSDLQWDDEDDAAAAGLQAPAGAALAAVFVFGYCIIGI